MGVCLDWETPGPMGRLVHTGLFPFLQGVVAWEVSPILMHTHIMPKHSMYVWHIYIPTLGWF